VKSQLFRYQKNLLPDRYNWP